jgi:RimJ/RimL family protein N-acetyltransferase
MINTPLTLETPRLLLRPFELADAPCVQRILDDERVSAALLDTPHPFTLEAAHNWIQTARRGGERGDAFVFALIRKRHPLLIGCIDIEVNGEHRRGDMAYWLDPEHWGQGFTTEAARRIVRFGFESLGLHRIHAQCIRSNTASARVMEKAGLHYEALLRESALKDGIYVDVAVYGLTRADCDLAAFLT